MRFIPLTFDGRCIYLNISLITCITTNKSVESPYKTIISICGERDSYFVEETIESVIKLMSAQ